MALELAQLVNHVLSPSLTEPELECLFSSDVTYVAPRCHDPSPGQNYGQFLAAELFPAFIDHAGYDVEVAESTYEIERTVNIKISYSGGFAYRYMESRNSNNMLTWIAMRGPEINFSVSYEDGFLDSLIIFTSGRYIRRNYIARVRVYACSLLRLETESGLHVIRGRVTHLSPRIEYDVSTEIIDSFQPVLTYWAALSLVVAAPAA